MYSKEFNIVPFVCEKTTFPPFKYPQKNKLLTHKIVLHYLFIYHLYTILHYNTILVNYLYSYYFYQMLVSTNKYVIHKCKQLNPIDVQNLSNACNYVQ